MKLQDNVAFITGGASGLGLATAQHLLQCGMKVFIYDLNPEVKTIAQKIGATGFQGNVVDKDALCGAMQDAASTGRLTTAIACAGIAPGARMVSKDGPTDFNHFKQVVEVNLLGSILLAQTAADLMIKHTNVVDDERGVIVLTASVAAFEGQIGQVAYSASKGGVVGMTLPAARELAKSQIRVMTIAPGLMHTPMMDGFTDEVRESLIATTLHPKRLGQASEYGQLVESIITNPMLNGSTIRLDGALRLAPR